MNLREPQRLPDSYSIYYRSDEGFEISVEIPSDVYWGGTPVARKHVARFGLLPKTGNWTPTGAMRGPSITFDTQSKTLEQGDIWIDPFDGSGEAMLIGGRVEFKPGELKREPTGRISFTKDHPGFTLVDGDFKLKR